MKYALLFLLSIISVVAQVDKLRFLDKTRLVEAVHYSKVGSQGERSVYQFKSGTWRDYSRQPFHIASTYHGQTEAQRVAEAHFDRLVYFLKINKKQVTANNLALLWNAGMGNFLRGRFNDQQRDYAARVSNLYFAQ